MSVYSLQAVAEGIDRIQARYRDDADPPFIINPQLVERMGLIHLKGVGRFWERDGGYGTSLYDRQRFFLTGLYACQESFGLIIISTPEDISIMLALSGGDAVLDRWGRPLQESFPGCSLSFGTANITLPEFCRRLPHTAVLTGNPAMGGEGAESRHCLKPLLHSLQGGVWAYMVFVQPESEEAVEKRLRAFQRLEQDVINGFMRPGTIEAANNPQVEHYISLIRIATAKASEGTRSGMWNTRAWLLTAEPNDLYQGCQVLSSSFGGETALPEPFRVRFGQPAMNVQNNPDISTLLTSAEVAALTQLPNEEFPGYSISDLVPFAVATPEQRTPRMLDIGDIQHNGAPTRRWHSIAVDELSRHVFISGMSGAGKSCTCFYLLSQLWEDHGIPWLVIEASMKSEYRCLAATSLKDSLQVFTLGDENCTPLRLNPFEIQEGVRVQTHIDSLFTIFSSAFELVPPMPEVLSTALHHVYEQRGWDLVSGSNPRGYIAEVQPVLSDLIETLEELVPALGYDATVTGNIRSGLITRLRTLGHGSRGRLLNTRQTNDLASLLAQPTILEMKELGDDDDKAFVMAAFLLQLNEYRMREGQTDNRLRHVTLLEEAHRLLSAEAVTAGHVIANPRRKAVEMLSNMLCEMRAFGQGFMIVDQAPAKLARDAIRNTNLKIAHRLVDGSDRQILSESMNLSEEQSAFLVGLKEGEAVVHSQGRPISFHVKIPNHVRAPGYGGSPVSDEAIQRMMTGKIIDYVEPLSGREGQSQPPPCQGCDEENCVEQVDVLKYLLCNDLREELFVALNEGVEMLWLFGDKHARQIWGDQKTPAIVYCVILRILSLIDEERINMEEIKRSMRRIWFSYEEGDQ
ncbi:MAG: ATP-binding protein [Candidatus Hydrogenedens sp.]|jgi:hypothetical protein|nr:ATP-binding protein [Candidatus Hydrogenedens sp.]